MNILTETEKAGLIYQPRLLIFFSVTECRKKPFFIFALILLLSVP